MYFACLYRDGAGLCGMAVAAFAVFEMMTLEQEVDMFYTAKQVMEGRPEAFSSEVIELT